MYKIAEYEAMRATIRQRGTVRICLILSGTIAWGISALILRATDRPGGALFVPVLILAATFEVSFFLHTGVERIGRYLQVFFDQQDGWESIVMAYGRKYPGGADPLFSALFALLTLVNFAASFPAPGPRMAWAGASLIANLALGWRIAAARRSAAAQRGRDLERFTALKQALTST
jgi:hypothetical protein